MASQGQTIPMILALRRRPGWRPQPLGCLLLTALLHALALWWLSSGPRQAPAPVTPPTVTGRLVATLAPAAPPVTAASRPVRPSPATTTPHSRALPPVRTVSHTAAAAPHPAPAPQAAPPAPAVAESRAPATEAPVSPPMSQAAGLNNPDPTYPALSQRLGEEGVVVLSVLILANGNVAEVAVQRSSGYPRLDEAALAAVRRWHYRPARRAGVAIDYRYSQPIRFSIDESN
ncbi:energy transducer TonB [Paludibacterium sp. THUN1379]|uniref:energy transducer TonB n=1 Tax=Paludibacterium sp. THUN1379 TaxID=3112107 RepID=UPI003085DC81|nr:energy transducer TonB [Paludibacterium sp. THUN1379]